MVQPFAFFSVCLKEYDHLLHRKLFFFQIVFIYVKKKKNYEKLCYEIKVFAKPFAINIGLN